MLKIKSILNRADWLQHISAWRTSGLTQAAYCREHRKRPTQPPRQAAKLLLSA